MRLHRFFILTCLLSLGCVIPNGNSHAEEADTRKRFIEFFVGACLRALPDIERTKAGARLMKWKPLEGDMAAVMAPAEKSAEWQGWIVPDGEDFFMVGVSKGAIDNGKVSTCVTVTHEVDQEYLTHDLESILNLRLISNETEALQIFRSWETNIQDQVIIISLTT